MKGASGGGVKGASGGGVKGVKGRSGGGVKDVNGARGGGGKKTHLKLMEAFDFNVSWGERESTLGTDLISGVLIVRCSDWPD